MNGLKKIMANITEFKNEYSFLSNFYPSPIPWTSGTIVCPTVEHFYQASKCDTPLCAHYVLEASTPGESKKRGRQVKMRDDWGVVCQDHMLEGLKRKFAIPELRMKLLATGDRYLTEGNWWHDNLWGSCECEKCKYSHGENKLGKCLMQVRDQIQLEVLGV